MIWRVIVSFFSLLFPWPIRRLLLKGFLGYEIDQTSRIGLSLILPDCLVMGPHSGIGHFTVCKSLSRLELGAFASIGHFNWINAYPKGGKLHFAEERDRDPRLMLGDHANITNRHLIDCTDSVMIGRFSTLGGFRSQILTHSIDLALGRQTCSAVVIGEYCFLGTHCTLLAGSALPGFSVLAACSLLKDRPPKEYSLYAGTPAKPVKELDQHYRYFTRREGFVV